MIKINIKEFKNATKDLPLTHEIKISCMTKEYTINNPNDTQCGYLFYCYSDGFSFEIDWNNRRHCYLSDFYKIVEKDILAEDEELITWDSDDGNIIHFEGVYIFENNIILYL